MIIAKASSVVDNCGLGMFSCFEYVPKDFNRWYAFRSSLDCISNVGGADYAIAGFINTMPCRKSYEILKRRFNIVFQSDVRSNNNSGNRYFFCVYDTRSKRK